MSYSQPPTTANLLEHLPEVRRLARFLVRDPNLAEDILQEVYLLALERPPSRARGGKQLWAWLRQVTRTLARQHFRSERRRRDREQRVSVSEHTPSFIDELLIEERAGAIHNVLRALPEPYGSTLRMRLLEGLEPIEIAKREGIASATVRMRLTRGLRMAQSDLHPKEEPERVRASLVGLFLFTRWRPTRAQGLVGCAALATVLALAFWQLDASGERAPRLVVQAHPAALAVAPWQPLEAGDSTRAPSRQALKNSTELPRTPSAQLGAISISGRAVWTDGSPAGGVAVRVEPPFPSRAVEKLSTSSIAKSDGSFTLSAVIPDDGAVWVKSDAPDSITVLSGAVDRNALLGPLLVVLAETVPLRGQVVDPLGRPIANASLRWLAPSDLHHRLNTSATFTKPLRWELDTDAAGQFQSDAFPRVEGASLLVDAPGYSSLSVSLPLPLPDSLVLQFERSAELTRYRGRVIDSFGVPVAGAVVCLDRASCSTESDGAFELTVEPLSTHAILRVASPGFAALVRNLDGDAACADTDFHELQLLPESPALHGQVVDESGAPLAGVQVLAVDLESACTKNGSLWSLEGLSTLPPRPVPIPITTGPDGRFRIRGLRRRPYRILAIEPRLLLAAESSMTPGDEPYQFTLSRRRLLPIVEGRVVNEQGAPVRDASIWVMRETTRILDRGRVLKTENMVSKVTRADSEGTFRLRDVPRGSRIHVEAPGILPTEVAPAAFVEIVISRRCELTLVDAPADARFARLLDEAGKQLPLLSFEGDNLATNVSLQPAVVIAGRTPVLTAPDRAVRLELLDGERRSIGFLRLRLDPNRPNRISALGIERDG